MKRSALFVPERPSAFGEREMEADEDKEDARREDDAGEIRGGREWKTEERNESARCCTTDLTRSDFLPRPTIW